MATRALESRDVSVFRELRLEALKSNPEAFSSSYDIEVGFDDTTWADMLTGFGGRTGQVYVDEMDGIPVGMAGIGFTETNGTAILWGMWVRESARRGNAGFRLVEASIRWADSQGADSVILHVAPDNDAAYRLYLRFGFEQIGEVAADPDDPCFMARLMKLDLTG